MQLKIDNWIVVNFQMCEQVNRTRKFIGKIDAVDTEGKFMVDFLRAASSETHVGDVYKYPEKIFQASGEKES